jgi:hypothetical protein
MEFTKKKNVKRVHFVEDPNHVQKKLRTEIHDFQKNLKKKNAAIEKERMRLFFEGIKSEKDQKYFDEEFKAFTFLIVDEDGGYEGENEDGGDEDEVGGDEDEVGGKRNCSIM